VDVRIHKTETVVRYQVTFSPDETRTLMAHPEWQHVISTKCAVNNGHRGNAIGGATLTKRQLNDVCDVIGVNGRAVFAELSRKAVGR
jgi:hypothetical protein